MQHSNRLGDNETRRGGSDEWDGDGLAGELHLAAVVVAKVGIGGIFADKALAFLTAGLQFVGAEDRPQLVGRPRVRKRVQAYGVKIVCRIGDRN